MLDQAAAIALAENRSTINHYNGCWEWRGSLASSGYATVSINNRKYRVSRLILGLARGNPQMALHSCDNPRCVNPAHLHVGDAKQNAVEAVERGLHPWAKRTTCKHGHPLEGENVRIRMRGHHRLRLCRTCDNAQHRKSYHKTRALARFVLGGGA